MIKLLIFSSCVLFTLGVHAQPKSSQVTHGWCSPAVSNVKKSVTIICKGVDPKAMARLNELLDMKDQQLVEKISEAEAWSKKYNELKLRLSTTSDPTGKELRATELLKEGRLEEAGQILDELLNEDEDIFRTVALRNYNRAQVYSLQLLPGKALPYFKKAYKYAPETIEYQLALADTLLVQRYYTEAEPHYLQALSKSKDEINLSETSYLVTKAKVLKGLAETMRLSRKLKKSTEYRKSLVDTYRQLVKLKGDDYTYDLANAIAAYSEILVIKDISNLNEPEKLVDEAVMLYQKLASKYPEKATFYLIHAMGSLVNIGIIQKMIPRDEKNNKKKSRATFSRVIAIHEQIGKGGSEYISVEMAMNFTNVAGAYLMDGRVKKAREALSNAILILEKRVTIDDKYYGVIPQLYIMQSVVYSRLYKRELALKSMIKAVSVTRQLVERNPRQYEPMLAAMLKKLARIHRQLDNREEAAKANAEGDKIKIKYGLR